MPDKDIMAESHDGGKFEFHQHGGGHLKEMIGGMGMYNTYGPLGLLVAAGLGYWAGDNRGHGGGHGYAPGYHYPAQQPGCCYATEKELMLVKELASKDSIIAKEAAEKFTLLTEAKIVGTLGKEICELKAKLAALEVKEHSDVRFLLKEDDCLKSYVNSNFIRGELVLPNTPTVTGFPSAALATAAPAAAPATGS